MLRLKLSISLVFGPKQIISASENSVVVTFPPWRSEWDREISDLSEIRKETIKETLIPRRLAQKKVRSYSMLIEFFHFLFLFAAYKLLMQVTFCHQNPNLKKLFNGDVVYLNGKAANVLQSDPVRISVSFNSL